MSVVLQAHGTGLVGGWISRPGGPDQGSGDKQQQSQAEGEPERQVARQILSSMEICTIMSCAGMIHELWRFKLLATVGSTA